MQTRTAFNGGEQSLDAGARVDMDAYMRGCEKLENWDVSCLGGVKRRRGMRQFAQLEQAGENTIGERDARLAPYVYSYSETSDMRFLVAVSPGRIRVFDRNGEQVADFVSDYYYTDGRLEGEYDFYIDPDSVNFQQLNSLLLITSATNAPLQLKCSGDYSWSLSYYDFKNPPWRYEKEKRDDALVVKAVIDPDSLEISYQVDFSGVADEDEKTVEGADELRISFWTDQQEVFEAGSVTRGGIEVRTSETPVATTKGTRFCVPVDMSVTYWVCVQEWPDTVYSEGLEYPSNYPDNFEKAVDVSSYAEAPVYWSVASVRGCAKGTKFGIRQGYWKYYTCIKDFTAEDIQDGSSGYDAYPDFFRQGVALGDALACQGEWEFWCSGTWYGEYAVIRNYESRSLYDGGWETAGRSRSYNESASNEAITGDESAEACYLRLMLLRSRRISSASIVSGWPPDGCGNRLIVKGFQYSQVLRASVVENEEGEIVSVNWHCPDKVAMEWIGSRRIDTWSWAAFSERYGYPRLCAVYGQRLVFAATEAQPQSVWMSQPDDYNNFLVYDGDDSAIAITLATTTQNPICWLLERERILLLGTSDKEYMLQPSQGVAVTADNLQKTMHGNTGSAAIRALEAHDKVLFIERGGGRCYEYGYNYEIDSYRANDLTVLAPHILKDHGGVRDASFIAKPERVAVFALNDGQVALCSYQSMHNVHAWHRWLTDGSVLSVCALPDGTEDDRFFLLVERAAANVDGADGQEEEKLLNIEVVDGESPYVDNFGRDYTSLLVTNSLFNAMQERVGKGLGGAVAFKFASEVPLKNMWFSKDGGETWAKAPRQKDVLPAGWQELLTVNNWQYEVKAAVKVTGDREVNILCLQG